MIFARNGITPSILVAIRNEGSCFFTNPKERLVSHIATERFEIPEYEIGGQRLALLSVAPYIDEDFHYIHLFPFLKFRFGQTNHRVYGNTIERRNAETAFHFHMPGN